MRSSQKFVIATLLFAPASTALADVVTFSEGVLWGASDFPIPCSQNVRAITRGFAHLLTIDADGRVECFGDDAFGQSTPPKGIGSVLAISGGFYHSVALKSDGTVACWGMNDDGQCNVPATLSNVVAIGAGEFFTAALRANGAVVCWGSNGSGESTVPGNLGFVDAIDTGGMHVVARRSDGTVRCWGAGLTDTGLYPNFGQSNPPASLGAVSAVTAGSLFSAAIRANGTVVCWGRNNADQCVVPADLGPVAAISAGQEHMVALRANGTVRCWGGNNYGQAQPPVSMETVISIEAAFSTSFALYAVGMLDCNDNGVADSIDIKNGLSRDANGTGVPDECEFTSVCARCEPLPVDVLLVADNSGSMTYLPSFCNSVLGPATSTLRQEFDLNVHWFNLVLQNYGACASVDGNHIIPEGTSLPRPSCDGNPASVRNSEDWGIGAALVSTPDFALGSWSPRGAVTVVMVLSDEGASGGNPCGNDDSAAVRRAIDVATRSAVVHVPVAFPDAPDCVYSAGKAPLGLMDELAASTGGSVFDLQAITAGDPATNAQLVSTMVAKLRAAIAASPRIYCPSDLCRADLNEDCIVGAPDLAMILGAWNTNDPIADLTGDAYVDAADLAFMLAQWGPCLR